MKRLLCILAATAISAAGPALAADMVYRGGTLLTEGVVGKPYWAVQAQCAGVYGAASVYLGEKGDDAGAERAKVIGVAFLRDAIDRVMKDRGLGRPEALDALSPGVAAGRTETLEALKTQGDGPNSKWNIVRSVCLDVQDAYRAL